MKILVAGDYCPCFRLADMMESENYSAVFGNSPKWTSNADYSIVNLECPVSEIGDYSIKKRGPNLSCLPRDVEALKWAGFNCVTLANNHFFDYGNKGVERTLRACKQYSLDYVGGGLNIEEASQILYKTINNEKLAIINCCEREFSIATQLDGGANPLNPIKQYYSIIEAKNKVDYVVVIVHGGHEHYPLPSIRMQEIYRFFIDAGADAVVNHHQHCYSGYELYNGKPIFYGLGNFCFDEEPVLVNKPYNYGYAVLLTLKNEEIGFELYPYEQCGEKAGVFELPPTSFSERINELNEIITDYNKLQEQEYLYYKSTYSNIGAVLNSNKNRVLRILKRIIAPSKQFSSDYILKLYNLFICESHRDRLISFLQSQYKSL